MQQINSTFDTKTTSQALVDAASAYLSPPAGRFDLQPLPYDINLAPIEAAPTGATPPTNPPPRRYDSSDAIRGSEPRIKFEIETPTPKLPSLLQYVDHVLMKDTSRHNHPPHAGQTCMICNLQWDKASTPSTFLPLSPCNDWVHYRCLIWLATRDGPHRDKCYACNTQLFEWDGINASTLATRTSLPMGNEQTTIKTPGTPLSVISHRNDYEQDCQFIDNTITRRFFNQLAKPTIFSDHSPNLVQCYDGLLNDLTMMGRPQSKWLRWSTKTGSLLFGMLVAIKMRRILVERHGKIVQTEAWMAWEDGCRSLQRKILEDVHKE